mgnify:CR=1 FL=1
MTEVKHAGGIVSSSKVPSLHLIPTEALLCLADRFEVGTERKGEGAWNALTKNQQCLDDKAFLIERCSHIIRHTLLLRDQLAHGYNSEQEDSPYENAGAIIFGGALMACAMRRRGECITCGVPFTEAEQVACKDCLKYAYESTGCPVEPAKCGEVRLDPTTDAWIPAKEWDGAADVADGGAKCVRCGCHVVSGMPVCNPCIDYVKNHTAPVVTFESPDDWVVQDKVLGRAGVDEYRWVAEGGSEHWGQGWGPVESHHNFGGCSGFFDDSDSTRLELRCRRKDLPVVESPDDWVVQDRVPARHRDRGAWVDVGEEYPPYDFSSRHWWTVGDKADQKLEHGSVDAVGRTLHLICRRKDLPELSVPTKEEWVDLNQYPDHVLRKGIDWIACKSLEEWDPVNGFTGLLVEDLTSEYKIRCLKKDLPPSLVPEPPAETSQSLYPPHADASFMCRNHGVVSGLEFSPAQKMWFWKNRSDVCWDLNGKARRISLDITDAELRGFDIVNKIHMHPHEE